MTTAAPIRVTPKQMAVAKWISKHLANECFPPTFREVQRHFAFKTVNGAACHINSLIRKGVLGVRIGQPRTLRVLVDLDTLEVGK